MLRTLTDEEVEAANLRRSFLYSSAFTIDNLTAILMDTSKGDSGLYENVARAKAHEIVSWLRIIVGMNVPERKQ